MAVEPSTEADVKRELLRLALHNAGRSVLLQVAAVVVIVIFGALADRPVAAAAAGFTGVVVAVWRLLIARRYVRSEALDAELVLRLQRELEGNAALAGLMWSIATLGIYPALSGTLATTYVAIVFGSITSAAFFMTLVGRSFAILAGVQLGALIIASLVFESVFSIALAALAVIFGMTLYRAAIELRSTTTRAIRHGQEAHAANASLQRAKELAEAANTSLQRAKEAADAANMAKSQFLATMSHEIRTPMNGVLGALELLRTSRLDTQQRRLVKTAASSGESLMAILNDVLDHSKIEAGKLNLARTPLSLHATAASVVALFRANAQAKGLALVLDMVPGVVDRVLGDAQRLKQVLLNLVGNAIKFTEHGSVSLSLNPLGGARSGYARVRFEVVDSGVGVPTDAMHRLFQPFQQVEASRGKRNGGTGLGLAISQKIVEAMGGRIGVDSQIGVGSSFHFDLSFEIDPAPPSGDTVDSAMTALDGLPSTLTGTVLVVEDNPVNRIIAEEMLESLGLAIIEAQDGIEALDVLSRRSVDLVLMDCQMPVMDGYTATIHIRDRERRQRLPRTPIVALTADAYEEDAAHALEVGMDGHLTKPYTRDQLREVISAWL
ncbi:MAG TPA: response regulator [Burkholderiaceae bacterium]|nr:response regulator [Burkholderiaceae bacterium]